MPRWPRLRCSEYVNGRKPGRFVRQPPRSHETHKLISLDRHFKRKQLTQGFERITYTILGVPYIIYIYIYIYIV